MPASTTRRLASLALLSLALIPLSSWSQSDEKVPGEVRKVDRNNQKITIKHGEIKSLDMPPMTMVFRLRDARLLEGRKVGERVRFLRQQVGQGAER